MCALGVCRVCARGVCRVCALGERRVCAPGACVPGSLVGSLSTREAADFTNDTAVVCSQSRADREIVCTLVAPGERDTGNSSVAPGGERDWKRESCVAPAEPYTGLRVRAVRTYAETCEARSKQSHSHEPVHASHSSSIDERKLLRCNGMLQNGRWRSVRERAAHRALARTSYVYQ